MRRSKVLLWAVVLLVAPGTVAAAELNFGGDIGFYLFDVSMGNGVLPVRDSTGVTGVAYDDTTGRVNMTFESHGLGLYWNVQLTDNISVSALTEVGGTTTGATPRLGKKLGTQQGEAGTQKALSVPEAYVQVMLPWDLQLSTGIIRPIFSEDYGEKKGYQEANRLFKSSANAYGGEWHDLGLELYKAFEPGGGFSIPTYLYVLAGEEMYGDNNSNKALMVHVAPEFWKLRLLGSYGFGKYDSEDELGFARYAAGLGGDFGPFWLRGEYFGGTWEGATAYNQNGSAVDTVTFTRKPAAYYVKAGYNFIPDKLGLVLTYDQYSPDWTTRSMLGYSTNPSGTTTESNESYTTIGATVQYWVIPGSSILLEYNRAMWKVGDGSLNRLDFNRITLGWRTVF